jgi:hypothetical protein
MINWPEMLHHAEDWAAGFWAGAGAASLMVIAGPGWCCSFAAFEARERAIAGRRRSERLVFWLWF